MKRKRATSARRKPSELEFDLMAVRDLKRLARRLVRRIELMERYLKKYRTSKASAEEIAAAIEAIKPETAEEAAARRATAP